jgi:hypothetical protein
MLEMNNIGFLVSRLADSDHDWRASLFEILQSPDVEEIHGNPQLHRVSFILKRARMREQNSITLVLETFGLPDLITALERLTPDQELKTYGVKNTTYVGSCFVLDDRIVGCEFVKRGASKTTPFAG